jgi:hypothetical protein
MACSTCAAAVEIKDGSRKAIIILDTAFLGQKAPDANVKWLLKTIRR